LNFEFAKQKNLACDYFLRRLLFVGSRLDVIPTIESRSILRTRCRLFIQHTGGRRRRRKERLRGRFCRRRRDREKSFFPNGMNLGLLSNFAATPFVFHGKRYASLEGFWQMMKYPEGANDPRATFPELKWAYTREQVAQLTSFEAKRAGTLAEENMKRWGITWVTFEGKRMEYKPRIPGEHYRLIVEATLRKFGKTRK